MSQQKDRWMGLVRILETEKRDVDDNEGKGFVNHVLISTRQQQQIILLISTVTEETFLVDCPLNCNTPDISDSSD